MAAPDNLRGGREEGRREAVRMTEKELAARYRNKLNRHQGKDFESLIEAACCYYRDRDVADIEKTPEAMKTLRNLGNGQFVAVYTKKAQADFKGFLMGGAAVCFEAKHTDTGRMDQDRVTPDQAERLERCHSYGGHAFVLCSFSGRDFFRVPWSTWRGMKNLFGHKYITPQDVERCRVRIGGPGVLLFLEGMEEKRPC